MKKETEESTLRFWGCSAVGYSDGVKKELADDRIKDKWIRKIIDNAPPKKKLRILDIGTGPGFFTIGLAGLGHDVTGVDVTKEMLEQAAKNAENAGVRCEFRLMNANDIDYPDDTFDLIVSRNVTWTLPDMFECYREWRRVLAPDGRIVVFDSNHYVNQFSKEEADIMHRTMRENLIDGTVPFYNDHFDFHVRWTYWEERPMIGTDRPKWDANALFKLRFIDIVAEEELFPDDFRDRGTSSMTFMIRSTKPDRDTENRHFVNEYWDAISGCVSARTVRKIAEGKADEYASAILDHIPSGSEVLDIGCGSGAVAIPLSKAGCRVHGIDRSEAMIDMAKLTSEENGTDIEFSVADAEALPFEDGSFDAVVMRNVLWNAFDPEKAIEEACRVLKPNGIMVITDGSWQANISAWRSADPDSDRFPNHIRRDLGLGAEDVVDIFYDRLPLKNESRPAWDESVLSSLNMDIILCDGFDDPMMEDISDVVGTGFILVARKN